MITTISRPQSATHSLVFVTCALLLAGLLVPVAAQQITGSIVGTVKDAQGALIPAATVKAANVNTGFARSAATDSDGVYHIQYLPVGRYNVEVEAAGFNKFLQQNIVLTVDQTQTLNVMLTVGVQTQTITVTEAPPLVNTSTAELGRTVQPAEITGLPLVNRNVYTEISLTPGVQSNSASSTSQTPNSPSVCRPRSSWSTAGSTPAFPWSATIWMAESI